MAFAQQTTKKFTKKVVLEFKQVILGVYGLFREGKCVFVGKGNIRERLLGHLLNDNVCLNVAWPSHWVYEATEKADARWKELLLDLEPDCNKDALPGLR